MCRQTLRVSGEGAVPGNTKYKAAGHREQHTDVSHEVPAFRVGVNQRLVYEKRVVMTHKRYKQ